MYFYQFNIGDYVLHTAHLSLFEDLAYRRLIDLYYSSESPISNDVERVSKLIRMHDHLSVVAGVLNEFFILQDDGYHSKRCDEELAKYKAMSEGGKKGAEIRWGKDRKSSNDAPPIAPLSPPQSAPQTPPNAKHKPITNNQSKQAEDPRFDIFWSAYPRKVGKADAKKEFIKAKINGEFDSIMEALEKQKRSEKWKNGFVFNPKNWIKGRHWEDEVEEIAELDFGAGAL